MKKVIAGIITAVCIMGLPYLVLAQDNAILTLEECYSLALKQSETVAINRERWELSCRM